jgi:hypothetical protein
MEIPEERIIEAVQRGNIGQLRRWGRQGLRVTSSGPLGCAAARGRLDVVQCLVNELGTDVDKADEEGCTALHHAAHTAGNIAVIRLLVKVLGAAVDKADQKGGTALHHATASKHVALVRLLVNELIADVNKADLDGRTALWIATCDGNLAIVKCLVNELGADIDKADRRGGTPLMAASAMKHADVVKWLVKAGANTQASAAFDGSEFTAAAFSNSLGASAEQTAYLEAKTHCSSPGCKGAGLLKCTGCKQARYCGEACQLAHWKAHKADCRRWSAELAAGIGNAST